MTPFLRQVADHYLKSAEDISRLVFIFPSRRAIVFFRKYLSEAVRESGGRPFIAPKLLTIEDFLSSLSPLRGQDQITLLDILYKEYARICSENKLNCESFDDFVFWGDIILGDYEDVDRYLADAKDLFRNVYQYKSIADDYSDLTPAQKEAIERFLNHFSKGGTIKEKFAALWNLLYPLYEAFGSALRERGMGYGAMIYRDALDRLSLEGTGSVCEQLYPQTDRFVFCGLNALCKCELSILDKFNKAGLAEFCWDYASDWIKDSINKSSFFMEKNIALLGRGVELEKYDSHPSFEIISVPSAAGQVKLLSQLLSDPSVPKNERSAIVLADEQMLMPMLESIPPEVEKVNVTMGYGLKGSSFYSLLDDIFQMLLHTRRKDGVMHFYHKPVWSIICNNIFEALNDENGAAALAEMKSAHRYYIPIGQLRANELLEVVFADIDTSSVREVGDYLLRVLDYIGGRISADDTLRDRFSLELDFAMICCNAVTLLRDKNLDVKVPTFLKLLQNILCSRSVPFKGEPLCGLQIMGPLEIRALDFDHLYILNANEGVFPRRNVGSSYIPALLRRAFELPTYEYQDAVWAYYFYRMIQRPVKVTMLLDSRQSGLKSGEQSRYIRQLEYHYGADLVHKSCNVPALKTSEGGPVAKTAEDIEIIRSRALSVTAIKNYLTCPAKFYYGFVRKLSQEDEVSETLDSRMIGNVFHHVMENLYGNRPDGIVSADYIRGLLKNSGEIESMVNESVMEELCTDEIIGRNIIIARMIVKYVKSTLERDLDFIAAGNKDHFDIISFTDYRGNHHQGVELKLYAKFEDFNLYGIIDRLDSFRDGEIRVVDYKTGQVKEEDIRIDDSNAEKIAAGIFDPSNNKKATIAFQCFFYDYLVSYNGIDKGSLVQNCIYSTREILSKPPVQTYRNEKFYDAMIKGLSDLLKEIVNLEIPFSKTENKASCLTCDFRTICGR